MHLVDSRHPRRDPGQSVHVGSRRADILGREVTTAQVVDRPTQRVEQHLRPGTVGIVPPDDGLAAALVEPRDGRLQRHRLRQPQHVVERVGIGGVVAEAHATERRAERGRMDGDHGSQPRVGVGDEHHLLVAATRTSDR